MSIEAGRLRHRVRIDRKQNLLDTDDDVIQDPNTGEVSWEWAEVATVWAAIEPLSAREFIQSQAVQAEIVARIVIRYRTGLDASMRLVHVRNGADFAFYDPAGFLADKETGLDYLTIPCKAGLVDD